MKQGFMMTGFLMIIVFAQAQNKDADAVKTILKSYQTAIEKLDITGIGKLFVKDSKVYELASDEGTIGHYLEHHLGPELKEFKSFAFSDYTVDVTVTDEYAFSSETYIYTMCIGKRWKYSQKQGCSYICFEENK